MTKGKKVKGKKEKRREEERKEAASEEEDGDRGGTLGGSFRSEDLERAKKLLKITELKDSHAIAIAVILEREDLIRKLLKEDYLCEYISEGGLTALLWAVKLKQTETVHLILSREADMEDAHGNCTIFQIILDPVWTEDLFMELVKLLENPIDVNYTNRSGHSLIHMLVKRQWVKALGYFLGRGLNPDSVTNKGATALMMASSKHQTDTLKLLETYGANLHLEDQRGCTALCYAISFMMQKKMTRPDETILRLLSSNFVDQSESSLNSYIRRRFELLCHPPTGSASAFKASIIVHVVTFFMRFVKKGAEALLQTSVFTLTKEALDTHMENDDYLVCVLSVLAELMRHCDCCTKHIDKAEAARLFYESGLAHTCITIIRKFAGKTQPTVNLYLVFLPFFLSCSTYPTRSWLQNNHKLLMKFYKKHVQGNVPRMNFFPDGIHSDMVKKSSSEFRLLINRLQKGEQICKIRSNEYMTEKQSGKMILGNGGSSGVTGQVTKDLPESKSIVSKKTDCDGDYGKKEVGEGEDLFLQILFDDKKTKYAKYQEEFEDGCKLFGITFQEDEDLERSILWGRKGSSNKQDLSSQIDKFAGKTSVIKVADKILSKKSNTVKILESNENCRSENGVLSRSKVTSQIENEDKDCTINVDILKQKYLESKDEVERNLVRKEVFKTGAIVQKEDGYEEKDLATESEIDLFEDEIVGLLNNLLEKYDRCWLSAFEEGYLNAKGGADEILCLMKTLPALETFHVSNIEGKWKDLLRCIRSKRNLPRETLLNILGELKRTLEVRPEEKAADKRPRTARKSLKLHKKLCLRGIRQFRKDYNVLDEARGRAREVCEEGGDPGRTEPIQETRPGDGSRDRAQKYSAYPRYRSTLGPPPGFEHCTVRHPSNHMIAHQKIFRRYHEVPAPRREMLCSLKQLPRRLVVGKPPLDLSLPPDDLRQHYSISRQPGAFGQPFLALEISGNFAVVAREVRHCPAIPSTLLVASQLRRLLEPLLQVSGEHVLPWVHWGLLHSSTVLATPLCSSNLDQLLDRLRKDGLFSQPLAQSLVLQVITGLHFLHSHKQEIVHGNLKPSNILVTRHGKLCLAEFGLHEVLYTHNTPEKSAKIWWAQETHVYYKKLNKMMVTKESDMQTCGMVVHYIATCGLHAFGRSDEEIVEAVVAGTPRLATVHPPATDLVCLMVQHLPRDRPTIQQVKSHFYLWPEKDEQQLIIECCGIESSFNTSALHHYLDEYFIQNKICTEWIREVLDYGVLGGGGEAKKDGSSLDSGGEPAGPSRLLSLLGDQGPRVQGSQPPLAPLGAQGPTAQGSSVQGSQPPLGAQGPSAKGPTAQGPRVKPSQPSLPLLPWLLYRLLYCAPLLQPLAATNSSK